MRAAFAALAALTLLAGCARFPGREAGAPWSVPPGPGPAMTPVSFAALPGWTDDHAARALPAFLAGCDVLESKPDQTLGGMGEAALRGGSAAQWRGVCDAARAVPPGDDKAARAFFQANFQPFGLSSDGSALGLFTGYYEPEVRGSRTPSDVYRYPIYRRPPDLGTPPLARPYFTRAQIETGALRSKHLELLWLADPIDAFFLHIQGAGRVKLPDGRVLRVSYDGQNGQPYVPIGRVLVDRGEMTLDQVSMQTIRAWLESHPKEAREVMDRNPSFVFFKIVPDVSPDEGPPGTLGAPLSPGRSLAVDRSYIPLGAPVWVDTKDPLDGTAMRRLMMAQDLGGAIRGPVRGDIFFGWGDRAAERAGRMRQQGMAVVLLPKAAQTASQ